MAKHSRRYREMIATVDVKKRYSVREAVDALLATGPRAKFDEAVEIALKLGIDTKQADQMVRGSFALPHGTGKTQRVIAFCEGATAEEAKAAGAVEAGGEELVKKVQDGWMDFDLAIAHPSLMRVVARLGRQLGPQGKMPSPKNGTVTADVVTAVGEFQGGRIEYRADEFGNVQVAAGRASWDADRLTENIQAFLDHLQSVRPATVKGVYIQRAALSTTMGPGLRLAV
ncbi:MAG: 50S ribosomal protein L1 [Planctomycetota bacterium]|jgi:large subunit ribosomal protein L1